MARHTIRPSPTPRDDAAELPSLQETDTLAQEIAHLNSQPVEKDQVAARPSRLTLLNFYLQVYVKKLLSRASRTLYARHATNWKLQNQKIKNLLRSKIKTT